MLNRKKLFITALAAMFSIGAFASSQDIENSSVMKNGDEKPMCQIWDPSSPGCDHH